MDHDELTGLLNHYRRVIDQMQGYVFYIEDDEGLLRRWYPPKRPITDKKDTPND